MNTQRQNSVFQPHGQRTSFSGGKESRIRGVSAGMVVLARVQKRHPGNPKGQLAMFFGEFVIKSGTGRSRPVSDSTNSAYADNLMRMIDELNALNVRVQNIGELGKTHTLKLIQSWIRVGQSSAYIFGKISILRRFLTFIGKENVIPRGSALSTWLNSNGIAAPAARHTVAAASKAWDENGVDLHEVLKRVKEECAMTAIQLEMQAAFGLRMKESLQMQPSSSDGGAYIHVVHGTKGGLPRVVNLDEDQAMREWQRDVLERAKLAAAANPKKTLSLPGKTLAQSRDHFYYVLRKVGIKKDILGVTAHGLRHQFVARRYREITGFGVPVASDAPTVIDDRVRQADLEARTELSRATGHFRPDVTQSYSGSISQLQRERTKNIRAWLERTEGNPEFVRAVHNAGVSRVWLGGNFALGIKTTPVEKLRLFVSTPDNQPLQDESLFLLKQSLMSLYQRGIDLSEHLRVFEPEDSIQLNLPKNDLSAVRVDFK